MCPVSGQVIESHAEVVAHPAVIEADPYGAGWFYKVLPSDLEYSLKCLSSHGQNEHREGERP